MKPTHWILIALSIALIVFDIVAACTNSMPTISEAVWNWSGEHPVIPFGVGVLCGHLFWQK